jgi:hypothetical protein
LNADCREERESAGSPYSRKTRLFFDAPLAPLLYAYAANRFPSGPSADHSSRTLRPVSVIFASQDQEGNNRADYRETDHGKDHDEYADIVLKNLSRAAALHRRIPLVQPSHASCLCVVARSGSPGGFFVS